MIHPAAGPDTPGPFSAADLTADLGALGVRPGDRLIVHVSQRSLGWVTGGPVALLRALLAAVGPTGTVVAPTFTTYLWDPASWVGRPVPAGWQGEVRAHLPGFDPDLHAAQPGLGRFPEVLRSHGAAVRSAHPVYSLAGVGPDARALLDPAPLDWALGERGPLGRLTAAEARVLAIGIPWWSRCTLFHLAEHRSDYRGRRMCRMSARVSGPSGDAWVETSQLVFHDGDFTDLGAACDQAVIGRGPVGAAASALVDGAPLVTAATRWMTTERDLTRFRPPKPFESSTLAPSGVL